MGIDLLKVLETVFLYQHVNKPTRGRGSDTPSCIDLVFSNEEQMVSNLTIGAPLGKSDHSVIIFDFICQTIGTPPKAWYRYEKADYIKMADMLNLDWAVLFSECDNLNDQWKIFSVKYNEAEKACVPQKIVNTNKKKFSVPLDSKAQAKRKRKHRLWQRYLETEDGKVYSEYRKCSNQLRNLTRKATKEFEKNLARNVKSQPKKFWKYVNNKRTVKTSIPDLYVSDDEDPNFMASADKDKANRLADFFSGVMTKEIDGVWNLINKPEIRHSLDIEINEEIVIKKLSKLKIGKSPGPDNIHPRVLKELKNVIVTPLTLIFKKSLETGTLPEDWKVAHISAIFKKGNKHVAGNYRPVSLTSIVCKLLESIIRDSLVAYMKKNKFFTERQFGFIGGRSTVLQLLKVLDKWTKILDEEIVWMSFTAIS